MRWSAYAMKLVSGCDGEGVTDDSQEGRRFIHANKCVTRAELCGVFMAVIRRVLLGSEKGIGKGTAALCSPPWGVRWSALHKRTAS